jgi:hypothetical protein
VSEREARRGEERRGEARRKEKRRGEARGGEARRGETRRVSCESQYAGLRISLTHFTHSYHLR